MIDASATRRPSMPATRPSTSTTAPIAHVPTGWKKPRAALRTCVSAPTRGPAEARAQRSEDGRADLAAGIERRKEEQIPQARGAGAAARPDAHLRHVRGALALEPGHLGLQPLARLPGEAHADVGGQVFADGKARSGPMPLRRSTPGDPYAPAASMTVRARTSPAEWDEQPPMIRARSCERSSRS